jgi:hypothetical protein
LLHKPPANHEALAAMTAKAAIFRKVANVMAQCNAAWTGLLGPPNLDP